MTGSPAPGGKTVLAASAVGIALALFVVACGSNGSSKITTDTSGPEVIGELSGVVYGPTCVVEPESCPTAKGWPSQFGLVSAAYAQLSNEQPFGIRGAHVTLSSVTEVDASDGRIDFYDPIVETVPTDADGRYSVISHFVETLQVCESINSDRFVGRLLVSVSIGDPTHQGDTRAFVTSTQTDIDAASEAVVRLVLERIFELDPPVQLCDFDIEGLRKVERVTQEAAFTAQGDTVGEINADAYRLASENCRVWAAIDEATGTTVEPPQPCLRG